MPSIPCPHCGRSISDQSKRCLYCAKPLVADAADAGDADKRARMLAAMYVAGVGLPARPKESWIERQRDKPLHIRLAIFALLPLIILWPPTWWKWFKTLFRP